MTAVFLQHIICQNTLTSLRSLLPKERSLKERNTNHNPANVYWYSHCHFHFSYESSSSSLLGYKHPLYQDWQCQRFWWRWELRVRDSVCVERLPGSWIQLPVQEWQPYPGASCRDALRQQGRGKTWNKTTQAHTESQPYRRFFSPWGGERVWCYYAVTGWVKACWNKVVFPTETDS